MVVKFSEERLGLKLGLLKGRRYLVLGEKKLYTEQNYL